MRGGEGEGRGGGRGLSQKGGDGRKDEKEEEEEEKEYKSLSALNCEAGVVCHTTQGFSQASLCSGCLGNHCVEN